MNGLKSRALTGSCPNTPTGTPAGKFMLTVFASLSQLEREQLKQRQREGIEIAKAQGNVHRTNKFVLQKAD